jgi:hypothetical protein
MKEDDRFKLAGVRRNSGYMVYKVSVKLQVRNLIYVISEMR